MAVVSVVKLSQVEGAWRLDADYYQPEYIETKNRLSVIKTVVRLKDVASITTGPAYSSKEMGENFNIPMARIGDVTNKTGVEDWIKLSREEFEKFDCKKIGNLDILMTMTGDPPDVGKCNLIKISNDKTLAFNQRVAKVSAKISPYYLFAYLSTEIARMQSERSALGIRQRNVSINDLKNIRVVLPSPNTSRLTINNLVNQHLTELENSNSLYSQAENLLLEGLGLKDFKPEYELSYTANLSKAFGVHRVDAEYFQPIYDKLVKQLATTVELKPLGNFLLDIKKGIEVGGEQYQEEGKPFIRVSNLSVDSLTERDQKYISETLYGELARHYEPKIGELLLTKDATPGIAYVLKESIEGIISSGILRMTIDESQIKKEYLALCIDSMIGKLQVKRDGGGSVITHWKPAQIKKLQVPLLPNEIQQRIASLVEQSHEARRKAKELLEEAKNMVEQMIETAVLD